MACEYESYSVFEQFTDRAILDRAFDRLGLGFCNRRFIKDGLTVRAIGGNQAHMDALKQAYQVEAARAALKKKGFFVTEKKQENGKILLTVRA